MGPGGSPRCCAILVFEMLRQILNVPNFLRMWSAHSDTLGSPQDYLSGMEALDHESGRGRYTN